jgi:hypothetical protein
VKVFQRIEVWVLLLLAAGAAVFVFLTSRPSDPDEIPLLSRAGPASADTAPRLRRIFLERDYGNARLDLELRVTNPHPRKEQLVPPFARLINAAGKEVEAFFLPMEPPPTLDPQTTADVRLRYWLEAEDLRGRLMLEVDGVQLPIKADTPVDLSLLENAKPTIVRGPPWTAEQ